MFVGQNLDSEEITTRPQFDVLEVSGRSTIQNDIPRLRIERSLQINLEHIRHMTLSAHRQNKVHSTSTRESLPLYELEDIPELKVSAIEADGRTEMNEIRNSFASEIFNLASRGQILRRIPMNTLMECKPLIESTIASQRTELTSEVETILRNDCNVLVDDFLSTEEPTERFVCQSTDSSVALPFSLMSSSSDIFSPFALARCALIGQQWKSQCDFDVIETLFILFTIFLCL